MTGNFLFTGHAGPLTAEDSTSIQRIADFLAGDGLEPVRLAELEAVAIHVALEKAGGNRTHAAKALGISVRTLQRKLKAEHLADGDWPNGGPRPSREGAMRDEEQAAASR